jgi:hypothetical protein
MFLSPFGKQFRSLLLCLQVLCFCMSHTFCQAFLPEVTLLTSRGESRGQNFLYSEKKEGAMDADARRLWALIV